MELILTNLGFLFTREMTDPICFAGIIIARRLGRAPALHAALGVVVSVELFGREWLFECDYIRLFPPRLSHGGDNDGA
jgi:hypothetical protein